MKLLTLNRMAEFLSERTGRSIAQTTPYWWWKTHKAGEIPVEMPEPVEFHGQSPIFDPQEIEGWYIAYLDAIGEPYDVVTG